MTVTIHITGLEPITEAMNNLARALGSQGVAASFTGNPPADSPKSQQQPQVPPMPGPVPTAPMGNFGAPAAPTAPLSGGQAGWTGPQSVPNTSAGNPPTTALPPAYTQDQIAVAMTGLVDQGKQPQVLQILAQFGAASLMQVPKEQYPALASQLRMLGANL